MIIHGFTPVRSARLLVTFAVLAVQFTMGQSKDSSQTISVSGFVDAYYSKNFADPASRTNKLRNFDIPENQINLSLAEIVLQKKAQPVGFRMDVDFGTANDVVQGIAPYGTTPYSTLTNIQQAYLTGVIPVGNGLTVDIGKFVTHMGYEVIESKDNWNYSRSLLFAWAIPYYHTGLRLTYPFVDNFTVALHVVNGWNSNIDNNAEKSLGLAVSYSPTGSTGLILNVIDGFEQPTGVDVGKKKVFDFIVTQQVSEAFALTLNADYGDETTISGLYTWKGAAVYGRYAFSAKSALALRGEIFDDPRGYATGLGVPQLDVKEVTATYEYKFADALLVRGEGRYDFSNALIFDKKADVNTESGQLTFLVGIVAMF
ncbi:MAG TPA: porin [Bacteroidota bacterium]|nr:porin [Bacteroidota bacterium]